MATPTPNPGDSGISSLLSGAAPGGNDTTAGGGTGQPAGGGFGVAGVQVAGRDTAGNEIITVGTTKVSLDARVSSSGTVPRKGTTTIKVPIENSSGGLSKSGGKSTTQTVQKQSSVAATIQEAASWTATQKKQFVNDAIAAGLITTKNPSLAEIDQAWSLAVQEASLQGKSPEDLLTTAKAGGWSSTNPTLQPADAGLSGSGSAGTGSPAATVTNTTGTQTTNTTSAAASTSQTSYVSYLDPASVQSAMSTTWRQLLGRNPTQDEIQGFLGQVYNYEDKANTGTFESGIVLKSGQKVDETTGKVVDTKTGAPVQETDIQRVGSSNVNSTSNTSTNKSIVNQRGINQTGVGYLAEQSAMNTPEYGTHQAATTYFKAFQDALHAPASGMGNSGLSSSAS